MQPHHAVITDTQSLALRTCVGAPMTEPPSMGEPVEHDATTGSPSERSTDSRDEDSR